MIAADYFSGLLLSHGLLLKKMSELISQDQLLGSLAKLYERSYPPPSIQTGLRIFEPAEHEPSHSPYDKLEETVQLLEISDSLEDYLWCYPHYRAYTEAGIDLSHTLICSDHHASKTEILEQLLEEARNENHSWRRFFEEIHGEPLPKEILQHTNLIELRLRSHLAQNLGFRHLAAV